MLKIRRAGGRIVVEDDTNIWRLADTASALVLIESLLASEPS